MGSSGILRLPQGLEPESSYGVDLLEAKSRSFDSFDKYLDRLNVAIAIYLKGQNLTTEVTHAGAYSTAGWHMRVRVDYAENDADALSEALRTQLINRWGQLNVAGWDDRMGPWPTWNLTIPDDKELLSNSLLKSAKTIEILLRTGAPIDWEDMLPKMGIQLRVGTKMPNPEDIKDEETVIDTGKTPADPDEGLERDSGVNVETGESNVSPDSP
jgi:hypothetical protein